MRFFWTLLFLLFLICAVQFLNGCALTDQVGKDIYTYEKKARKALQKEEIREVVKEEVAPIKLVVLDIKGDVKGLSSYFKMFMKNISEHLRHLDELVENKPERSELAALDKRLSLFEAKFKRR